MGLSKIVRLSLVVVEGSRKERRAARNPPSQAPPPRAPPPPPPRSNPSLRPMQQILHALHLVLGRLPLVRPAPHRSAARSVSTRKTARRWPRAGRYLDPTRTLDCTRTTPLRCSTACALPMAAMTSSQRPSGACQRGLLTAGPRCSSCSLLFAASRCFSLLLAAFRFLLLSYPPLPPSPRSQDPDVPTVVPAECSVYLSPLAPRTRCTSATSSAISGAACRW